MHVLSVCTRAIFVHCPQRRSWSGNPGVRPIGLTGGFHKFDGWDSSVLESLRKLVVWFGPTDKTISLCRRLPEKSQCLLLTNVLGSEKEPVEKVHHKCSK